MNHIFGDTMKEIKPEELKENPFTLISKDWFLVTAEKDGKVNTMTAAWGGLGFIWGKNAVTIYIRNSRYTKDFLDAGDTFSLCVMPESCRKELVYCGKASGRDEDKVAKCGFTVEHKGKTPYFKEARMVLNCRKMFVQEMKEESFTDKAPVTEFYGDNDWHVMYIAEIESVLVKE